MYKMYHEWNRKDKEPNKTIDNIYKILNKINLKPIILEKINCDNECFSVNLEMEGFPGIFSNGKGITYEYALASALGEFMERLQTGQLFHKMYSGELYGHIMEDKQRVRDIYQKYFEKYVQADNILNICKSYKQFAKMQKFYSVFDEEFQDLPIEFIDLVCGSNGTCAGNTTFEAVVQGICELFERYAVYRVYFDKKLSLFSTIAAEYLHNLKSYHLLMEIEKKGFNWEIKDLTLGDSIPVIGLILWNKDRTKYSFAAGSDVDIDIAIQRCITEIFQGIKWDFNFRNYMKSVFHDDNYFWPDDEKTKHEYIKTLKNKTGRLPIKFLISGKVEKKIPDIFNTKKMNNQEAYLYILNICRKNGWDVFVRDYSFLGFPSYRIYIPGISEAAITPGDDVCKMIISLSEFKDALKKPDIDKELLLDKAKQFYSFPKFYNIYNLTKLLGIIVDNEIVDQYEMENVMYTLSNGLDVDLRNYLPEFSTNPSKNSMRSNAKRMKNLSIKGGETSLKEVSELAKMVLSEDIYDSIFECEQEFLYPSCFKCKECKLKKYCKYNDWMKLYNMLVDMEKGYHGKYQSLFDKSAL